MQYFESAMALLDTLPDTEGFQRRRLELLVSQLAPMLLPLQFQEYYDLLLSYEAMAVRLGGLLGAWYARLGFCEWWLGCLEQAIGTLTKAIDLCEAAGNTEDAGQAYLILYMNLRYYVWSHAAVSWALTCLGRWEEAVATGRRALHIGKTYLTRALAIFECLGALHEPDQIRQLLALQERMC